MRQPFPRLCSLVLAVDLSSELLSVFLDAKVVKLSPSRMSRFHHGGFPLPKSGNSRWRGSPWGDERERRLLGRVLERRLAWDSATRRRIGQALTLHSEQRSIGALEIVNPESDPIVVPEVELGGVAVQMGFAHMEVAAVDSAFEDREVVFRSVGVPEESANVFLGAVVHRAVPSELPSNRPIDRTFVGHQVAGAIDVGGHYRSESLSGNVRDVEAADPAIALDQRQHSGLGRDLAFAVRGLSTDESLVALDNLICAAKRTGSGDAKLGHGFANAMPEEPRGFQTALERALKLTSADTLFRRAEQVNSLEPHSHWHMARLENGADLDGERLAARVALAETNPVGLSTQSADLFFRCAAVWANRTIWPETRLDVGVSGLFAMEMGDGKVRLHGLSP